MTQGNATSTFHLVDTAASAADVTATWTQFDLDPGNTQLIDLEVTTIDDKAPKITSVKWDYAYQKPSDTRNADGSQGWTEAHETKTLVLGTDTSGDEAGYVITPNIAPLTNKDVTITVVTDKDTKPLGEKTPPSTSNSKLYGTDGLYIFNQEAANGTTANYGVDVRIIDKTPPVLLLAQGPELVFIEGMTADKNPEFVYNKDRLMDYTAYDLAPDGTKVPLTDKVTINYGKFNPDDMTQNKFDRTSPYFIEYTVYDAAGNKTTALRTLRLVGFYDTIALINGKMPNSTNMASVAKKKIDISLKNFSGISYARYEIGSYTMGQMKSKGTMLVAQNGVYTIPNVEEGWYTIYIQTDKRDYFNISVYVGKPQN